MYVSNAIDRENALVLYTFYKMLTIERLFFDIESAAYTSNGMEISREKRNERKKQIISFTKNKANVNRVVAIVIVVTI